MISFPNNSLDLVYCMLHISPRDLRYQQIFIINRQYWARFMAIVLASHSYEKQHLQLSLPCWMFCFICILFAQRSPHHNDCDRFGSMVSQQQTDIPREMSEACTSHDSGSIGHGNRILRSVGVQHETKFPFWEPRKVYACRFFRRNEELLYCRR